MSTPPPSKGKRALSEEKVVESDEPIESDEDEEQPVEKGEQPTTEPNPVPSSESDADEEEEEAAPPPKTTTSKAKPSSSKTTSKPLKPPSPSPPPSTSPPPTTTRPFETALSQSQIEYRATLDWRYNAEVEAARIKGAPVYEYPYICGGTSGQPGCRETVWLTRSERPRCKGCGSRVLFKARTLRMQQFEAR